MKGFLIQKQKISVKIFFKNSDNPAFGMHLPLQSFNVFILKVQNRKFKHKVLNEDKTQIPEII